MEVLPPQGLELNLAANLFESNMASLTTMPIPATLAVHGSVQNLSDVQTSRGNRPYVAFPVSLVYAMQI